LNFNDNRSVSTRVSLSVAEGKVEAYAKAPNLFFKPSSCVESAVEAFEKSSLDVTNGSP
jgi:hypothetical protein